METAHAVVDSPSVSLTDHFESDFDREWRGPLFVIGMWRSGTSLLYALLNKHPQIGLMYEGDLLLLEPLFWMSPGESRWLRRWEFWNRGLERHGIALGQVEGSVTGIQGAAERVYAEYASKKGALIGGEKSPNYFDCLTRLADDFPHARFLVIWRDPASICRSVIRAAQSPHSWFDRKGMALRVLLGTDRMRRECDRLQKRGARVHELNYQELVGQPVEAMKGICRFLDIPFVPAMASLEGADRSAIYEHGHHELVKGERIVASMKREEVLPAKLKGKIARYMALWREQDPGRWPQPSAEASSSRKPSLLERISDEIRYRYLRAFDMLVILAYCFAPLWLLKRFRALKYQREEVRARHRRTPSPNTSATGATSPE